MREIYLLILFCIYSVYISAQTCVAPQLNSQQQVNDFQIQNPGCKVAQGNMVISGPDITNLQPLSAITNVTGDLTIATNSNLSTLTGLGSLATIGGRLTIINNPALVNVNGLESLTNITNGINVERNSSLISLSGLQSLESVQSYLRIVYNPVLTSIDVFNKITTVSEFLSVGANPLLENLSGLRNISSAHEVAISLNDNLSSLDGLKSLKFTTGYLYIGYNAVLKNLQGLNGLKSVGNYLQITNNNVLASLSGLDSLESVNQLQIYNCPQLSECAIHSVCMILKNNPFKLSVGSNGNGCNSTEEISAMCALLPVNLVSFTGESSAEGNVLKWTTDYETNNKGFEVETSSNGRVFQTIGFVPGNMDSNQKHDYSFTDRNSNLLTYYRLKQIDWDVTFAYSRIIKIHRKEQVIAVYPNPSRGHLFIQAKNRNQPYQIKNSQGVTVLEASVLPAKEIKTESLESGIYFLIVGSEVIKIMIQ